MCSKFNQGWQGTAELFGVEINTVNYHLKEIFKSNELIEDSVIRKIRITAVDGKKYLTSLYNLDAIIAVGYRVNSYQATQFRIWATQTLKEFILKGFVLDDQRLSRGKDSARITLMNYWNVSARSAPVFTAGPIKK